MDLTTKSDWKTHQILFKKIKFSQKHGLFYFLTSSKNTCNEIIKNIK